MKNKLSIHRGPFRIFLYEDDSEGPEEVEDPIYTYKIEVTGSLLSLGTGFSSMEDAWQEAQRWLIYMQDSALDAIGDGNSRKFQAQFPK